MKIKNCDICGRQDECTLVSSGCAPVTYSACPSCQLAGAEDADVAITWVHFEGGPERAPDYKCQLVVWLDGAYVKWPEIQAYYEAKLHDLIMEHGEKYVLVDDPIDPEEDFEE